MAPSIEASAEGLKEIERLRKAKGWRADEPKWCEAAHTSSSTLRRFRQGDPIQQDTFILICKTVGADWREIFDRGEAIPTLFKNSEKILWEVIVEADDDLKAKIFELIQKHSGDANLKIRRIDKGSLIFVLEGSLEGFERMEYLYREGLISELAGAPILNVHARQPVRLSEWLQNNFGDLWQPPALAFARTPSADEENTIINRAKSIQLGTQSTAVTVQLTVRLTPQEQGTTEIMIQVHPAEDDVYLPTGLQLSVVEPESRLTESCTAREQDNWIQLNFVGEPEAEFMVQLQLDDVTITEDFIV